MTEMFRISFTVNGDFQEDAKSLLKHFEKTLANQCYRPINLTIEGVSSVSRKNNEGLFLNEFDSLIPQEYSDRKTIEEETMRRVLNNFNDRY